MGNCSTMSLTNVSEKIVNLDMKANMNPLHIDTSHYEEMRNWLDQSTDADNDDDESKEDEEEKTNQFEFRRGGGEKSIVLFRQSTAQIKPKLNNIDALVSNKENIKPKL